MLHPYGLVAHAGRWYVTGADLATGPGNERADRTFRTFRLDRIADARALPGTFEPPAGFEPARRLLDSLAAAPYRHHVVLRLRGTVEQVRTRLPASVATLTEVPPDPAGGSAAAGWLRAEIRAEELGWLPPLLASLDLPFVIERPAELRERVLALAGRLAGSAQRPPGGEAP